MTQLEKLELVSYEKKGYPVLNDEIPPFIYSTFILIKSNVPNQNPDDAPIDRAWETYGSHIHKRLIC